MELILKAIKKELDGSDFDEIIIVQRDDYEKVNIKPQLEIFFIQFSK